MNEALLAHLKEKHGIEKPTAIQELFWKSAIDKNGCMSDSSDVILKAQTGSGKTLAFLLPILSTLFSMTNLITASNNFKEERSSIGTVCIILSPTRELAQQIHTVLAELCLQAKKVPRWIVPGLLIGGEKKKSEKSRVRKGCHILVATPGRLLDHLENTEALNVSRLKWVVLDEADRLLDLGFEKKVKKIMSMIEEKQSKKNDERKFNEFDARRSMVILCSATVDKRVLEMAGRPLIKPLSISADESNCAVIPDSLEQYYVKVDPRTRFIALISLLKGLNKKTIVFFSCCDVVDYFHALFISLCKVENLLKLHGNLSALERTEQFSRFTKQSNSLLFCTDVAARGLDLKDVPCIIQFDAPCDLKDYVHRIGRTARVGLHGESYLFLMESELPYLELLSNTTQSALKMEEKKISISPDFDEKKIVESVSEDEKLSALSRTAFTSFVRAYATHTSSERHIFHIRKLHLGHLAKGFGLKAAPSALCAKQGKEKRKAGEESGDYLEKKRMKQSVLKKGISHNEFSSGI